MIGAPNSLNLNCKVRVMKEAPGPSVSEEIADIFTNHNIDVFAKEHIDGLLQDCGNSIAKALELLQTCIKLTT